jgi:hypothetical protein
VGGVAGKPELTGPGDIILRFHRLFPALEPAWLAAAAAPEQPSIERPR